MVKCENCDRVFRDIYNLTRHQSRLYKCVDKKNNEDAQKSTLLAQKSTFCNFTIRGFTLSINCNNCGKIIIVVN